MPGKSKNFDELVGQEARVRRVSRMIPVTGQIPAQTRSEIRAALEAHMKENGLAQADVAECLGTSATYVNNLLTEAAALPVGTRDRLLRDVNNWLEREARAAEAQRPDDFVTTRVAERLIAVAERLTERADMAVAHGPAGIGKSTTIAAIVAEIPTAVALIAGYDTRTAHKFCDALYHALTSRRRINNRTATLADLIIRLKMPDKVQTRNLLIIDQAHQLSDAVLPLLCELHDRAKCSILLVGTIDLKARVATDDDPEFGQLSSRVGMRVNLAPELAGSLPTGTRTKIKCFTVTDIRKLFAHSKLKLHADAARLLAAIANTRRGTLRRVCRLFDWAEIAARHAGSDTITTAHIQAAASLVEDEFELPTPTADEHAAAASA